PSAPCALHRSQPARGRPRGQGPGRRDALPPRRRNDPRARGELLLRADRCARDRRSGCSCRAPGRRTCGRDPHAHARRRLTPKACACRARRGRGARVRVAILGGTGSFGRALAARLVAAGEDEVVIGSRDAERAAVVAGELGAARGSTNDDAVRSVDLAVLAVKADAALGTVRETAAALDETPLLSVASVLAFARDGVRPDADGRSLAERVQDAVRGPVAAGLHSIA